MLKVNIPIADFKEILLSRVIVVRLSRFTNNVNGTLLLGFW